MVKPTRHTLVMVGGVGKSCLTLQFLHNRFIEEHDPTIEEVDIQDTAGQEEYSALRDQYLGSGEGFMLVYSITSRSSFEDIKVIHNRILRFKELPHVPCCLAGNKSDLEEYRDVPQAEAKKLADEWKCPFYETSAKSRTNVDNCFFAVVKEMVSASGQGKKKCTLL